MCELPLSGGCKRERAQLMGVDKVMYLRKFCCSILGSICIVQYHTYLMKYRVQILRIVSYVKDCDFH